MMLLFMTISIHECLAIKLSYRIFGGIDAKSDEYPYVVGIEEQISYNYTTSTIINFRRSICSASALSPVWLITAAHCLVGRKNPIIIKGPPYTIINMVIRYGHIASQLTKNSFSEVQYTITHPSFSLEATRESLRTARNDIGLLKTSPMEISCYMKISAVDYRSMYGHEVVIGGFGLTSKQYSEGHIVIAPTLYLSKPLQLLKGSVSKCGYRSALVPGLCVASRCGNVTVACAGDSGGPVIHPSGLIGVISLSEVSCQTGIRLVNTAAYITPVSPYIEWIYSYINI